MHSQRRVHFFWVGARCAGPSLVQWNGKAEELKGLTERRCGNAARLAGEVRLHRGYSGTSGGTDILPVSFGSHG